MTVVSRLEIEINLYEANVKILSLITKQRMERLS